MKVDRITSADGAAITLHTTGTGPGVVILHDGLVPLAHYHGLAEALEHRFTVHLYDRRGRADAAPLQGGETVATDLADLSAVLEHTGAVNVLGHGTGGFLALRAALRLPLERVAVYDPLVSLDGSPVLGDLDELEQAVATGDHALALTLLGRARHPGGAPFGLALLSQRVLLRTPSRRAVTALLPAAAAELRRIRDHDGPPGDYAAAGAEILLAAGTRSPEHFAENCRALAEALPHAQALIVPGASHDAATAAPHELVRPVSRFLAGLPITD
ncbi:alpha/beta fold hydrolase [Catellatospora bangladeshensis]|uniref:AB hydrolase-1 domain-containing protein n=1 Tax=Catellatospora bangladeshensis TaxID=310355 RepID=A0A8J3NKI4_9ACTN|nr:alpha/beta fold hydrolase [Catellatospora bangladeshensis]GIF83038.1 hypothetical protein Cba03nite_43870 [Catellatospora bangladeshensis]